MERGAQLGREVLLTSRKLIVERGTATTIWYVEVDGQWLPAHDFPGAVVTRLAQRPGTVWESETALTLPVGTHVKRVDATPAPERRMDPLSHLRSGSRLSPRATRELLYVVGGDGKLTKTPARR